MPAPHYRRPGWVTRHLFNPLVTALARLGLALADMHTLAVRGRRSGEVRTTPVNPFELDGQTYLLAPRGETEWVRNLRAAGEGELRGARTRRFRAVEVTEATEKLPLLRLYVDRWSWEVGALMGIDPESPDDVLLQAAPRHPAFRLTFVD